MKGVLAVIDLQKNFIRDCCAENLVRRIAEKIKKREKEGYETVFTYDAAGGDFTEEIYRTSKDKKIFKKHTYGSEELIAYLQRLSPETVEFVGVCTDKCVITNVLGTLIFLPDAEITVDPKCCASADDCHAAALRIMKSCNIKIL